MSWVELWSYQLKLKNHEVAHRFRAQLKLYLAFLGVPRKLHAYTWEGKEALGDCKMCWNSLILCWWEASTRLQDKWLPPLFTSSSSLSLGLTGTFKGAPHPLEGPPPPASHNQRFKPVANYSKHFQANKSSPLRKTKCQSSLQESERAGSYHRGMMAAWGEDCLPWFDHLTVAVCWSITVCLINMRILVHDLKIKFKKRVDTIVPVHIHQVSGSLPFGSL